MQTQAAIALLTRILRDLGLPAAGRAGAEGCAVPLPARTAVDALAWAVVTACAEAAAGLAGTHASRADPDAIAVAYASDRWFRIDGHTPDAFAPLSGFFRCDDGWVRTHGNYPYHAAALRRALGLDEAAGRDELASVVASRSAASITAQVTAAGGLCVVVAPEDPAADARQRRLPLAAIERTAEPPPPTGRVGSAGGGPIDPEAPLRGIRVLDMTRVIAGPVATRTLALLGADVLRIDPPALVEIAWQHLDTGHGKRSTLLDVKSAGGRAVFDALLEAADVVVLGYRPSSLARLGLTPAALAARRPGVVVAQLSAWGEPDRRGFDSLVQAACGIAMIEGSPDAPGVLPAQALDHSAGYLLAAGVMAALRRRAIEGGSWTVTTSLRRVAAELLGMPRSEQPGAAVPDATGHTQTFTVDGSVVTTASPALRYPGAPTAFAAPRPWGADAPAWRD
ncbi:CoA transferase [Microbacterium luticocti]|uniref:CoA transferase n=1 Tax=Microbacterium luticocti TaxID=451764 RepID=UPI00041965A8|nr:CoA transferase [Microbacterium luticocti]